MVAIEQTYNPEELFHEHEHLAEATLYHTFGNPYELARGKGIDYEDLLQVAYMGLWEACNTFDESKGSKFQTHAINTIKWTVFPSLTNDFNVFKYATNRVPEPEERFALSSFDAPVNTEDGADDLHGLVADNEMEAVEEQATFEALLDSYSVKLSDRQKKILRLKYEGWMNADIAEELGITRQAVGQACSAIKKMFKNHKEALLQ